MSYTNDTKKVADEIGRQVFELLVSQQPVEQPYLDFLAYRNSKKDYLPDAEEILGNCAIDGVAGYGVAYK